MQLREYRRDDLGAMFALDEACFEPPFRFSARAMRQFAEARNALTVVAESENGEIAGFCITHVERSRGGLSGYIVTLDVDVKQRRRGLAGQILERIEQQAREAACEAMVLHVSVENKGAIAFYEMKGYERSHMVKSFYGLRRHAYVYRKPLTSEGGDRPEWSTFVKAD